MEPTAELLALPKEYGRATRKLAWATVRAELEQATQYWIATSRADGRTHMVPVDGLWLDDVLFYGGSSQAVHYRNALANPNVVVHLADPVKAVIVEGDARLANPSRSPRSAERSSTGVALCSRRGIRSHRRGSAGIRTTRWTSSTRRPAGPHPARGGIGRRRRRQVHRDDERSGRRPVAGGPCQPALLGRRYLRGLPR